MSAQQGIFDRAVETGEGWLSDFGLDPKIIKRVGITELNIGDWIILIDPLVDREVLLRVRDVIGQGRSGTILQYGLTESSLWTAATKFRTVRAEAFAAARAASAEQQVETAN